MSVGDSRILCHLVDRANSDNLIIPGTLSVGGVSIAGSGPTPSANAAVAEASPLTGTKAATTHITFAVQLVTGTDITAPDNKTFQVNSTGMYSIYGYCIITPATADAGMRQFRLVGSGSGNGSAPGISGNTATWTPDGVSNGTSKRVKLTFHCLSYHVAGDQFQLDFENRDATNDTPIYDAFLFVQKLY